MKAHVLKQKH